ncbi:MAG TPA: hypothetical protein VG604_00850 [Candidatus Saccharimonadales bacterium]|nr:hypothetical protein [Candidatus Saccharimonadales bacterium]
MNTTNTIVASEIQIASIRFSHEADQVKFESFPKRLIFKGREYVLAEA